MPEEIDRDLAERAVGVLLKLGADYGEARIHQTRELVATLRNGEVEPMSMTDALGISVRALVNGSLSFASTNRLTRESVEEIAEVAYREARAAVDLAAPVSFSRERAVRLRWGVVEKKRIEDVSPEEVYSTLSEIDSMIVRVEPSIRMRLLELTLFSEAKVYVNSEGSFVESYVPRVYFFGIVTAVGNGRTIQRMPEFGGSGGWELVDTLAIREQMEGEAKFMGLLLRKGRRPPEGLVDVVTGPEVTGIISHESIGHPFEADRVLGREAAQAGESYLTPGDVGTRIGSEEANISEDPTIPGSMGFYLIDDEGVVAKRRRLVVNGVIRELLHNRATASFFGLQSNASSRASLFNREPIIRMANTYVEPGDYSFEELVGGVKLGVYMKSFMEWNIDDRRLNQRYTGHECYLIENGELKDPVIAPVLEIDTKRLWSSLDARGKNVEFWAAWCGKGDPLQGAPVWAGGPSLRLRNVRVTVR